MQNFLRFVAKASCVALVLVLVAGMSFGQATNGTIAGVVTDATGAAIANAKVTVTSTSTGEVKTVESNSVGAFRVESLLPGGYVMSVSASGFAVTSVKDINVAASTITPVNPTMKVGQASEVVNVEAEAAAVQTETGELSKNIPAVEVKDLPYGSLNPYQLATTLPGVTTVAGRDNLTNGTSFAVNGLRPRSNNFLLDGFDNNDNSIMGQAFQPSNIESVREVTVLTNSYAAEYGRGGGSVSNLTFKNGTNDFHGAAWEQYQGAALDALTPTEKRNGETRPSQFVQNIFGFRVGGPVLKNKLFFFTTSQWTRFVGAQGAATLTIPTAAGVATLQSINTPNVQTLISTLGDVRAAARTASINIGNRPGCVVSPNTGTCAVDVGVFNRSDKGKNPSYEWTSRVDFNATQYDTIFVRYTGSNGSLTPDLFANSAALPTQDTQQGGPSRLFGTMWAHTFTPSIINEFRFSAQQIDFKFSPLAATLDNAIAHLPTMALSAGLTNRIGGFSNGTFPQGRGHKTLQFQDAVSLISGKHTMKFGADVTTLLVRDQIPFNADGTITFSSGGDCSGVNGGAAFTCTALANFIDNFAGPSGSYSKQFGNPLVSTPTVQQAYYFQDSWKMRSNFTVDLGLRYEYQPQDANNVLLYPAVDPKTFMTEKFPTSHPVQEDRNNFGPRVGFAYTPHFFKGLFGEDKTVIRGGYGIFYDAFFTNISDNTAASSPNTLGGTVTGGAGRGPANPIAAVAAIAPALSSTNTIQAVVDNLKNPMIHQWNLNVQRELPLKMQAEVAYVGTRGEHLWINQQLNPRNFFQGCLNYSAATDSCSQPARFFPAFGAVIPRTNGGDSVYHGLQTTLTRRVANFTIRGSYTWSKSLDNQSEVFATSGGASRWENVLNPNSDRGPSAFDRRQRAAISYVYNLPGPKTGIVSYILGGWSTSGIISYQTGVPQTLYLSGWDQNGDGETANDRPDLGNPAVPINYSSSCLNAKPAIVCSGVGQVNPNGTVVDWNTGAAGTINQFHYLVYPQNSGHMGNLGRNSFYYPGQQNYDLSVLKNFKVHESHELQFRADFFNAFNHANLGVNNLNGNVNSVNFLNIKLSEAGARAVTLWMKYQF